MLKRFSNIPLNPFKNVFKTEDTRFIVLVGLKVSGISFAIMVFIYFLLFEVMRLNHAFFKAHGFPDLNENSPFYDYIISEALENLPMLFAFHIFLFFIGVYVGWIILRPFRVMGEYCDRVIENPNAIYKVDDFSTYRLFTRFSELFFEYIRESRKNGEVVAKSIPPQYSRIHKPVFDKLFMLHFGILLLIISITSALFIIQNTSTIYQSMIELATRTLHDAKAVNKYFSDQMFLLDDLVDLTIILISLFYTALGLHLYNKVSGAAFGIFSTMRAFMKGNRFNRVHLVGYAYVRDYTRKLNKYLDYVQNTLDKDKKGNPKG